VKLKKLFVLFSILIALPLATAAQTTKPGLKKTAPKPKPAPVLKAGTVLKVRLNDTLSSKESRSGDKFTATVMDPVRLNEAVVHGHISSIVKSGKVKGRTTMNLAFDRIRLTNGKEGVMHGYVTKIYGAKGSADDEGGVQSESRGNQTAKRTGIGAAAGAIFGGLVGGGKGAAIGLVLGGAGGAGSLAVKGSKELKLESGTEMLVQVTH
jgi:hypothetical protein